MNPKSLHIEYWQWGTSPIQKGTKVFTLPISNNGPQKDVFSIDTCLQPMIFSECVNLYLVVRRSSLRSTCWQTPSVKSLLASSEVSHIWQKLSLNYWLEWWKIGEIKIFSILCYKADGISTKEDNSKFNCLHKFASSNLSCLNYSNFNLQTSNYYFYNKII